MADKNNHISDRHLSRLAHRLGIAEERQLTCRSPFQNADVLYYSESSMERVLLAFVATETIPDDNIGSICDILEEIDELQLQTKQNADRAVFLRVISRKLIEQLRARQQHESGLGVFASFLRSLRPQLRRQTQSRQSALGRLEVLAERHELEFMSQWSQAEESWSRQKALVESCPWSQAEERLPFQMPMQPTPMQNLLRARFDCQLWPALPDEIKLMILPFIGRPDLKSLRQSCHHGYRLASPILNEHIKPRNSKWHLPEILELFAHEEYNCHVRSFTVDTTDVASYDLWRRWKIENKGLRKLIYAYAKFKTVPAAQAALDDYDAALQRTLLPLEWLLRRIPWLRNLAFTCDRREWSDPTFFNILRPLVAAPPTHLTSLVIFWTRSPYQHSLAGVCDALNHSRLPRSTIGSCVKSVHLYSDPLYFRCVRDDESFAKLQQLAAQSLAPEFWKVQSRFHIGPETPTLQSLGALSLPHSLRVVMISTIRVEPSDLRSLLDSIRPNLKLLVLDRLILSDSDLQPLFSVLSLSEYLIVQLKGRWKLANPADLRGMPISVSFGVDKPALTGHTGILYRCTMSQLVQRIEATREEYNYLEAGPGFWVISGLDCIEIPQPTHNATVHYKKFYWTFDEAEWTPDFEEAIIEGVDQLSSMSSTVL